MGGRLLAGNEAVRVESGRRFGSGDLPRSWQDDPHAHYCGNPIDAAASLGGMRTITCAEQMVETVDHRWLCPVCNEDEHEGLVDCECCGLHFDPGEGQLDDAGPDAMRKCPKCWEEGR